MARAEAARQLDTARACSAAFAEARAAVARAVAQSKQQARAADEERDRAAKVQQVRLGIQLSLFRLLCILLLTWRRGHAAMSFLMYLKNVSVCCQPGLAVARSLHTQFWTKMHMRCSAGGGCAGSTEEPAVGAAGRADGARAAAAGRREGAERRCGRRGRPADGLHEVQPAGRRAGATAAMILSLFGHLRKSDMSGA